MELRVPPAAAGAGASVPPPGAVAVPRKKVPRPPVWDRYISFRFLEQAPFRFQSFRALLIGEPLALIQGRLLAQVAIENRDDEQRRHGGPQQPSDDRAAQRRILLTAFAQSERHR